VGGLRGGNPGKKGAESVEGKRGGWKGEK